MIPPPIVGAVSAALTLTTDTNPIKIKVNKPRGTIYWGGAGLDGPYIADQVAALTEVGIQHVFRGTRTYSMPVDAARSTFTIRYRDSPVDEDWTLYNMEKNAASQFNMIGYSYGSLVAAQTANFYAFNGHIVDNLILIGSPIDKKFLDYLGRQKNIRNVIPIDLGEYGDPLYAGIPRLVLYSKWWTVGNQMIKTITTGEGHGHFYYASATSEGARRRRNLARKIYRLGLK